MSTHASTDRTNAGPPGAVRRLFDELVGRPPAEQKRRLAAVDDLLLQQEVEGLLEACDQGGTDAGGRLAALEELRAQLAGPAAGLGADADADADLGAGAGPPDPEDPLGLEGTKIGRYEVGAYLGGGGMGVVYRARDPRLDRTVALKFLPPHLSRTETARRRFVREAKAASALDHPNIATVHEIGETEKRVGEVGAGQLFIAMTYYTGETLKAKLAREGALPVGEAVGYATQIAEGLGEAHRAGLVHRDVKPANVIVTEGGTAKLVDFGLAKTVDRPGHTTAAQERSAPTRGVQATPNGRSLTRTGQALGTAAYMSPEQARGRAVDARTDLWSLGIVLYEMLVGERPFVGKHSHAVIEAIQNETPRPFARARPDVPAELAELVDGLLRKRAGERPSSAVELLADLQSLRKRGRTDAHWGPAPGGPGVRRRGAPGRGVALWHGEWGWRRRWLSLAPCSWSRSRVSVADRRDLPLGTSRRLKKSECRIRVNTLRLRSTCYTGAHRTGPSRKITEGLCTWPTVKDFSNTTGRHGEPLWLTRLFAHWPRIRKRRRCMWAP